MHDTLKENIAYIEKLQRLGIKPGLNNIMRAMEILGNPHEKFKSVHIAGTNGKGSTSSMISSVLKEAGYKVGLYLSPYVASFNERIQINGICIEDEVLDELIAKLREIFEDNNFEPTFFEFITALAFYYFAEQKIEIGVIETGLGGRLDATNVISSMISVITNISYDHIQILGSSKEEIAREKAGIIKENQICITAESDESLRKIFAETCKSKNSKLIYTKDIISSKSQERDLQHQEFTCSGIFNDKFQLKLLGKHQIDNAEAALAVCHYLNQSWDKIPLQAIHKGLQNATIRGRLEVYSRDPLVILDGAHNSHGMRTVKDFISHFNKKSTLIIGISKDKDSDEMLHLVAPEFERVIVTQSSFKPKDLDELFQEAKKHNSNVLRAPNCKDAITLALKHAEKDGLILIAGSLYLVSDALKALAKLPEITTII